MVSSSVLTSVGNSYAMTVKNVPTVTANSAFAGGASAALPLAGGSDVVSFTIEIVNPCLATTLNTISFTSTDATSPQFRKDVVDGNSATALFTRPTTATEDSVSPVLACGTTSYSIHSSAVGANFSYTAGWAVITGPVAGVYSLTVDTTKDLSLIGTDASATINIYIKATLDDYTAQTIVSYTRIDILISQAVCSCAGLVLDVPASSVALASNVPAAAATI